jgi:hypothetical protein
VSQYTRELEFIVFELENMLQGKESVEFNIVCLLFNE